MQSRSLKKYVADEGMDSAITVWGVSRQAIEKAIKDKRDIQVVELDGCIEVIESKVLSRVRVK